MSRTGAGESAKDTEGTRGDSAGVSSPEMVRVMSLHSSVTCGVI